MCISHTLRTRGIENEMSKGCLTTDWQDYSLQSGSPWRGGGGRGGGADSAKLKGWEVLLVLELLCDV